MDGRQDVLRTSLLLQNLGSRRSYVRPETTSFHLFVGFWCWGVLCRVEVAASLASVGDGAEVAWPFFAQVGEVPLDASHKKIEQPALASAEGNVLEGTYLSFLTKSAISAAAHRKSLCIKVPHGGIHEDFVRSMLNWHYIRGGFTLATTLSVAVACSLRVKNPPSTYQATTTSDGTFLLHALLLYGSAQVRRLQASKSAPLQPLSTMHREDGPPRKFKPAQWQHPRKLRYFQMRHGGKKSL